MQIGYYDKEGKPIGTLAWAKLFEDKNYRIIKQTTLPNKKWVSTVWLGLDYSFEESKRPLIFETMVFARKFTKNFEKNKKLAYDLDSERYSTIKEAIEGHGKLCRKWVKKDGKK